MRFRCLFLGHKFEFAEYLAPMAQYTKREVSIGFDGTRKVHNPRYLCFTHWGVVSRCEECGKVKDVDLISNGYKLPVIMPSFPNERS